MSELAWDTSHELSAGNMTGMNDGSGGSVADQRLLWAIVFMIALYGLAGSRGIPQSGTAMILASHAGTHTAAHEAHGHGHGAAVVSPTTAPAVWTVIPFALLLGAIAILPLIRKTEHWWESNLNRFYVAAGLGVLTLLYYGVLHTGAIERHFLGHAVIDPAVAGSLALPWTVLQNAILNEYIPFITLLLSLYVISGSIRITGDLRAHPVTNTAFIGIGALLASFIGTTGAAMLLIRPLLETNSERKHVRHTVVFFVFVVCNTGGCLLPIGDPPLFLGYLQGVDFTWTFGALWQQWLFVNLALLSVYFVWDHFWAYPRETKQDISRDERLVRNLKISGLAVNGVLLFGVILSVALLDPSKTFPGTDWHPWLFLREVVQFTLIGLSLVFGSKAVRKANKFNYHAILEVAVLFFGIFICMQPALQILGERGSSLGIDSQQKFFWATGGLSAVLDNAPTYLVFFKTAQTLPTGGEQMAGVAVDFLVAISLGAVFMGAMTYIGNGPNFMVKAIAEKSGVRMPSFFGYMVYSCLVLLPILFLTTILFFGFSW